MHIIQLTRHLTFFYCITTQLEPFLLFTSFEYAICWCQTSHSIYTISQLFTSTSHSNYTISQLFTSTSHSNYSISQLFTSTSYSIYTISQLFTSTSHSMAVLSQEPEHTLLESWEYTTTSTLFVWPKQNK